MHSLEQRRLLMLAFALAAVGTAWVPLPGVDPALHSLRAATDAAFVPQRLRLFALFLGPYLGAAGFALLASGAVPALRALREGDAKRRPTFDHAILGGAIAVACVQAAAYSVYYANVSATTAEIRATPWMLAATLVLADALLLAAALSLTRWGVGNGVAVALAGGVFVPYLLQGLRAERSVLPLIVVPGLAIVYHRLLRAAEEWPLVPSDDAPGADPQGEGPAARPGPVLRMRHNLVGAGPGILATSLMTIPFAVAGLLPAGSRSGLEGWLGSSPMRDMTLGALTAAAVAGLLAVAYDPRAAAALLARHGYRVQGVEDADLVGWLDRHRWRRFPEGLGFSLALGLGPDLLARYAGCKPIYAYCLAWPLLICTAVLMDTLRHDRVLRILAPAPSGGVEPGKAGSDDDSGSADHEDEPKWLEWGCVDTELEGELVRDRLARAGIPAQVACNRAIAITGTFGLWEWCPPRFPSLMIHRRLGAGAVTLWVRACDVERASAMCAPVAARV